MTPDLLIANLFLAFDYLFTPYIYQIAGYIFFGAIVLAIVYIASKR